MLIIVNSDILYTNGFVHQRLHQEWNRFADGCRSVDAELVIPRTALYEIELRQQELYDKEVDSITTACGLLQRYGVDITAHEPTDLIKMPDIIDLFCQAGVKARVEETTLDDFRDAERRAAMHLPPVPPRRTPSGKQDTDNSDEMRDLVIWAVACRLAVANGGAVLLSRDKVHSGSLGRSEADEIRLLRAIDFTDALGMVGAETPAGSMAVGFLGEAWDQLRQAGIPLRNEVAIKTISGVSFVQGAAVLASARFRFGCDTDSDRRFSADVHVYDIDATHFRLTTVASTLDNKKAPTLNVEVRVERHVTATAGDVEERLSDLRDILG